MIILNETEWARQMLDHPAIVGDRHECLRRIARYYIDSGEDTMLLSDVALNVETYLRQCSTVANICDIRKAVSSAMKSALKYEAVDIGHIYISSTEIKAIKKLGGRQIRRLAFTLLCISKYWDAVRDNNNHWTHNDWSEIMKMANINTSLKRQALMFNELTSLGMIQLSKRVDNLNVRVLFADDSDESHKITDFRNLGYQYLVIVGEPYFYCSKCGIATKYTSANKGRQIYCPECAYKTKLEQNASAVSAVSMIREAIERS